MNKDTYFNNGNLPPGFEETPLLGNTGFSLARLRSDCRKREKQRALDSIYGHTPFDNDTYALNYKRMSSTEREAEDKRVSDILNNYK